MDPITIGVGLTALFLLYENITHDKKSSGSSNYSSKSSKSSKSFKSSVPSFSSSSVEGPKVLSGPMSETSPYVPSPKEQYSETSIESKSPSQSGGSRYYKKRSYQFDMAF